jgi:hypothetical protein
MRKKPTNEARAATHPAIEEDYQKLAAHVVSAIANKCRDVVIKVPYFIVFADDWPKGILIKRDASFNWYRVKAFKAADWLHRHGYLAADAKGTVKSMRTVNNLWGEIDRLLTNPENLVDTDVTFGYNDVFEIEEGP